MRNLFSFLHPYFCESKTLIYFNFKNKWHNVNLNDTVKVVFDESDRKKPVTTQI